MEPSKYKITMPGHNEKWAQGFHYAARATQMPKAGSPGYSFAEQEEVTGMDVPVDGTTFTPKDAQDMYRFCLGWVSYPYGVPADMEAPRPASLPIDQSVTVNSMRQESWVDSVEDSEESSLPVVLSHEDIEQDTPSSAFSSSSVEPSEEIDEVKEVKVFKRQIFQRYGWGA